MEGLPSKGDKEIIAKWMSKIDLGGILAKTQDMRSVSGLERALERMSAADTHRTARSVLKNYVKVALACKEFLKSNILAMCPVELDASLQLFAANNIVIPQWMKRDLLTKRSTVVVAEGQYEKVFEIMNPYDADDRFDPSSPTLSGTESDQQSKLKTFYDVIMEKLVVDMINKGQSGVTKLVRLCRIAVEKLEEVDFVVLDLLAAREYSDQLHVFKGLLGLLTDKCSVTNEDISEVQPTMKMDLLAPHSSSQLKLL
eukprot:6492716-Amphidinium_carterae.2